MGPTDLSIELPVINVYVSNPCTCKKASRFEDKKSRREIFKEENLDEKVPKRKERGKKKRTTPKPFVFCQSIFSEEEISSVKDFLKKSDEDGPQSNSL